MFKKTKLVRIGNSQGVLIPKPFIEEIGVSDELEMIVREDEIVLRAPQKIREDWDLHFEKMAKLNDDVLFDKEEIEKTSIWDDSEWTW